MKYPTALPYFPDDEIELILKEFRSILKGEGMLSMGPNVKAFEEEFSKYLETPFAVATSSCSASLEIAMRASGIKPGDEVIVPSETFIATGETVVREGGRPVFAEVSQDTYCLTLKTIKDQLSEKTRAIIIVHMAGFISPEIFEIRKFCDENNFTLIEDAAHAHGSSIDGKKSGSIGHVGCFSFYPTKMMTTGEGGMLVTFDKDIYKLARSYVERGLDVDAKVQVFNKVGTNNRMTEIAALMGRSQLRCLDGSVKKRNKIASIYDHAIESSKVDHLVKFVLIPKNETNCYWRYLLTLDERIDRNKLREWMRDEGVAIDWAYYPALHLQPVFIELYGNKPGMLPETENLLEHNICLPIHFGINEEDAHFIVKTLLTNIEKMLD